ncbi:MAG TPA: ABC transporter ATP-binding protein [Patescibacteria group bacterium]|nr:ABC transporter ATP-binding protein [Patescibacteria group bacterium]
MHLNRQTLLLYWQQSKNYKVSFFTMLLLIPLGAAVIDSALPYVLSRVLGAVSSQDYDAIATLLWLAGATGVVGAMLNYIGFSAMVWHESNVIARERLYVFQTLIHKDSQFFSNQKIGAMTSRYIDFIRNHITIQDLFIIRTLGFVLTLVVGLWILALSSWFIALLVLSFIVLLILQIRWSAKRRAPWRHERKRLVSEIHGSVADSLTNNLIVRTFAGETREIRELETLTSRFSSIYRKDIGFVMTEGSLRVVLMIGVQIAVVMISVSLIRSGALDIATGVFVLAYMQRVGSQLFVLGDIINGYDQALLDAQPMTEMLLADTSVHDAPDATSLTVTKPSIDFDAISYHYDDSATNVLEGLSLHIPAGQKIGLVGHSGAGKSTLVQLLLRFSDPSEGTIRIDTQDIASVTQQSLRTAIAYVPQEPLLFHRSLRENIAYGKEGATEAEIIAAAKQANAYEFIQSLEHGLDTMVGERGVKLSGGQRQRIAIARAILKNAPILLLDEATSALDSESERLIQASLETLMQGRTSVVIAHRLSTIAKLDRIIVLEQGRIVEDGTHAELLNHGGIYATLWGHQSGGFIED